MARRTDAQSERRDAEGAKTSALPIVGLAVLVVVASVALRGYVPGAQRAVREPTADNPFAMFAVVALLVLAVAVVMLAAIVRARQRTAGRAAVASRPDWLRGDVGKPTWRMALIAFGLVVAALLAALALSSIGGRAGLGPPEYVPPDATESSTPKPRPGQPDSEPRERPAAHPDLIGYFYAATGVFLFALVAGSIVAMRRPPRSPSSTEEPEAGPRPIGPDGAESLARAAEFGLAEVEDPARDPRAAIIACYAAMERELARMPEIVPQDFDTASEVLARAVDHHALQPDSATQLVDLFDEARFSPHVMNEGHREIAVQVLQRVLAELEART